MTHDETILELRKQIDVKTKELSKPVGTLETNCVLHFRNSTYNLNVLSLDALKELAVELTLYTMAMEKLGFDSLIISFYEVTSWLHDVKIKMELLTNRTKKNELNAMKTTLDELLSTDKKTELKLDQIKKLLG